MSEENYLTQLVKDVRGMVGTYTEGDRPLYHKIAENIFDFITTLFS